MIWSKKSAPGCGPRRDYATVLDRRSGLPNPSVAGLSQVNGDVIRVLCSHIAIRAQIPCIDHFGGNGASSSATGLVRYRDEVMQQDTVNLAARGFAKRGTRRLHAVV